MPVTNAVDQEKTTYQRVMEPGTPSCMKDGPPTCPQPYDGKETLSSPRTHAREVITHENTANAATRIAGSLNKFAHHEQCTAV